MQVAIFNYNQEQPFRDDPDLHLVYWGKEDCVPGHSVGPGVRDLYKIHFIHKGTGIVRVGGETHKLSPGQAFLIYPHFLTYYEADLIEPWTYSWIGFRGAQVESILSRTRLSPERPVFPMDWRIMPGLYEQLTVVSTREGARDLQLKAMLYEFLSVLVDVIPASAANHPMPKKQEAYILPCIEFLHAHYSEHISVLQLASFLGLDRKYLSALFKEATGMPPQQYLLQYRMDKACELLEMSKYSVSEVARSVGYQDALLFSKMFKKVKGTSPKQFRSKVWNHDFIP